MAFVLLVAGALALGQMLLGLREVEEAIAHETGVKSAMESEIKKRAAGEALAAKKAPNFAPAVEKALRPLIYPWNQVLATLEEAYGERVNVVRFEQSVDAKNTKLVVAGTAYENVEEVVERLQTASGDSMTWSLQSVARTPTGFRATIEGYPR